MAFRFSHEMMILAMLPTAAIAAAISAAVTCDMLDSLPPDMSGDDDDER